MMFYWAKKLIVFLWLFQPKSLWLFYAKRALTKPPNGIGAYKQRIFSLALELGHVAHTNRANSCSVRLTSTKPDWLWPNCHAPHSSTWLASRLSYGSPLLAGIHSSVESLVTFLTSSRPGIVARPPHSAWSRVEWPTSVISLARSNPVHLPWRIPPSFRARLKSLATTLSPIKVRLLLDRTCPLPQADQTSQSNVWASFPLGYEIQDNIPDLNSTWPICLAQIPFSYDMHSLRLIIKQIAMAKTVIWRLMVTKYK